MENGLIVLENLVPENIFKEGGCRPILEAIVREVGKHIPDVTTAKGRKEVASLAHKVAQSKTFLDNMGKDVKEKYKAIIDPIDKERKTIRDELDALKEQVRMPLTAYEEEQAIIEAERIALEKFNADYDQAIIDNDLFNREREVARKEAELKRIEDERNAKEEAERLEKERLEYEARLKAEAAENARIEAEERARKENEEAVRKQIEAEQAAKRAEEERIAAEQRAKIEAEQAEARRLADIKLAEERAEQAERKRIEDIEAAKRQAEIEKQQALLKYKAEQEEKERLTRIEDEKRKAIEEKARANKAHQKKINNEILSSLVSLGCSEETGKDIIAAIVKGQIKNISINY